MEFFPLHADLRCVCRVELGVAGALLNRYWLDAGDDVASPDHITHNATAHDMLIARLCATRNLPCINYIGLFCTIFVK